MKGVVIISLPPADDPSQGKTITAAFTVPDDSDPSPPQQQQQSHHHQDHVLPVQLSVPAASPSRSLLSLKRALAALLGFSLFISSLWVCLVCEAPLQLLRSSDGEDEGNHRKNDADSLLFTLYSKSGGGPTSPLVSEVKLGSSFLSGGDRVDSRRGPSSKSASSAAAAAITATNSSILFPLRGNLFPDGQYYASIFIGNPPSPYFLDVDTGSDLTWIQCDAPCASCAMGPHPLYKPAKGKIVLPMDSLCQEVQNNQNYRYCESCQQCDYEIEYADQSSTMGVLARDEMDLFIENVDRQKLDFVFGCAYDQQGQLLASPAKTDGILGLSSAKVSLPSQLASQGIINNVVGHCIRIEADGGGYMFLGDDFVPRWGMTWVPSLSSLMNYYHAEFLKLNYGGQQFSTGNQGVAVGQVVFDTGSSYTYFTNEAYTNLITSLESNSIGLTRVDADSVPPICWRADFPIRSVKDVNQFFEPIILQFRKRWWIRSTAFTIPPEGYLLINKMGNVCLGVLNGSEVRDGSTIILGDISLRGKLVVYDNVQQKIGWVESDCTKPQRRPRDFPFFF